MRTVGMIVARSGSTRVPGKALLDIAGNPVIWHMMRIARQISGLDDVLLATTTEPGDDALAAVAESNRMRVFRGHPENVLDRVHAAAVAASAETLVYIGGDCPLLDPSIISEAIAEFGKRGCDYLSNYDPPTFPGGMDVNVIRFSALDKAFKQAIAPSQRVHAFSYLTFHSGDFTLANFAQPEDLSTYHWSLDYPEDIEFLRLVYARLYRADSVIHMADILRLIREDPAVHAEHARLIKPEVPHAFLASPGMMKDINADIRHLCGLADDAIRARDYVAATQCYREIECIATKLSR